MSPEPRTTLRSSILRRTRWMKRSRLRQSSSFSILTNAVRDYTVRMTVDHQTEDTSGGSGDAAFASHKHAYKGTKAFRVHLALKAGEQVLLLRADGGQKFIILDRVEAPK